MGFLAIIIIMKVYKMPDPGPCTLPAINESPDPDGNTARSGQANFRLAYRNILWWVVLNSLPMGNKAYIRSWIVLDKKN